MLGVSLILLLMAKDFNCAHGYLFEFRKSGELQFCVSDEAVAFAKKYLDNYKEFTKVDVKDLNGADIPLAKYDCNLVLERGCEFWNTSQFNKADWSDRFPLVTDFRWNDLPVRLAQKRFESKFTILKGQNFGKHFSILAHDSAQFLFTDDPTFAKGLNIVIDGWGVDHISALRYCTYIPPEFTEKSYPTCGSTTAVTSNYKVLSQGEIWAHATLKIDQHGSNRNNELTITDKVIYAHLVPNSQMKSNSDYYISFRTNTKGLFKVHTYNVLHSSTVQSSMELLLSEDSSDSLCMDVIFLIRSVEIETSALSLEILDEMRRIQFNKVIKTDRTDEWITERISSKGHTLKRGWAVKLTAHIIEIVIGAVKFCKEGLMVIRPRQAMTNCSSLVTKNIDPTEEKNQLMQLLSELSGCGMFENNCAGVRACGQSGCSCLAGFHGDGCFRGCSGKKYGFNCDQTSTKNCTRNEINHIDGNCLAGCAGAFIFPLCEKECTGRSYGQNCSKISNRFCLNDAIHPSEGTCRAGCIKGYKYPNCLEEIQTAVPQLKSARTNEIILDMSKSLTGTRNIGRVLIQIKKDSDQQWRDESELHISEETVNYMIANLRAKTLYNIRFVLFENEPLHDQNFLPGKSLNVTTSCKQLGSNNIQIRGRSISLVDSDTLKEEYCEPKYLTLLDSENNVILNKTVGHFDFIFDEDQATCGNEYTLSLNTQGAENPPPLIYTPTCPPPKNNVILIATTLVGLLVAVLLIAIGARFYFKKWKAKKQSSTVAFTNNTVIINAEAPLSLSNGPDCEENIYELPPSANATEVEKYLLGALNNNYLKDQYEKFPRGQTQPWDDGTKPENRKKNRYGNLAAYDSSRVKLQLMPGEQNSDYINANYVDGYKRPRAYIASQGPRANTLDDFWQMVWQEKTTLIVMVTNLVESGKNKCEKYWPDETQEARYGRVTVRTVREEINADFVSRALSISRDNTNRLVEQLHYTNWPDHGVPLYPQSMAIFIEKITRYSDQHPILVHCSAGVGRTGTVILIDACLRMFRSYNRIDVANVFTQMRNQRVNLVDNLKQFEFAHLVLVESIVNPKFEVSCANFSEECMKLMANNKQKLRENFKKLLAICQRDFNRAELPVKNEVEKCRYPDLISSSNAIVRLFPYGNVVTMSFINAVFVDGYKRAKEFIATQVPMQNTIADFWRMIDQYNVKEIIVLNEPHISDGIFLPTKQGTFVFGDIKVVYDDYQEEKYFKTLEFILNSKGKCKKVSVKCVFGWLPGEIAPPHVESLIEFWGTLKITNEKDSITIVCHDGVTASGLFLGIGFVIEKIKMEQKVDVGLAVRTLRKSRPAFVSTELQFNLLYRAASMYLESFDTYGNFK